MIRKSVYEKSGRAKSVPLENENPLLLASKELDVTGLRIFTLAISELDPYFSLKYREYDEKLPELFISNYRLGELLGDSPNFLNDLQDACASLFRSIIKLKNPDGGFSFIHTFRKIEYLPYDGLRLQFDEMMRPYLSDLFEVKGYSKMDVEQIFYLNSLYSVRLIELMLQYQNKIRREITQDFLIDELKCALNVPKNAYKDRLDNLRQKVLDAPIAEINEKTIYKISYKTIKDGRNIIGFKIHMAIKISPTYGAKSEKAIESLIAFGFDSKEARSILSACRDANDCLERIARAKVYLHGQQAPIKRSVLEFLRTSLFEDSEAIRENKFYPPTETKKLPDTEEFFKENLKQKKVSKILQSQSSKKDLSSNAVEMIGRMLNDPKYSQYVERILKLEGFTLEEFCQKYVVKI